MYLPLKRGNVVKENVVTEATTDVMTRIPTITIATTMMMIVMVTQAPVPTINLSRTNNDKLIEHPGKLEIRIRVIGNRSSSRDVVDRDRLLSKIDDLRTIKVVVAVVEAIILANDDQIHLVMGVVDVDAFWIILYE